MIKKNKIRIIAYWRKMPDQKGNDYIEKKIILLIYLLINLFFLILNNYIILLIQEINYHYNLLFYFVYLLSIS